MTNELCWTHPPSLLNFSINHRQDPNSLTQLADATTSGTQERGYSSIAGTAIANYATATADRFAAPPSIPSSAGSNQGSIDRRLSVHSDAEDVGYKRRRRKVGSVVWKCITCGFTCMRYITGGWFRCVIHNSPEAFVEVLTLLWDVGAEGEWFENMSSLWRACLSCVHKGFGIVGDGPSCRCRGNEHCLMGKGSPCTFGDQKIRVRWWSIPDYHQCMCYCDKIPWKEA
jgi:hypothetical protein